MEEMWAINVIIQTSCKCALRPLTSMKGQLRWAGKFSCAYQHHHTHSRLLDGSNPINLHFILFFKIWLCFSKCRRAIQRFKILQVFLDTQSDAWIYISHQPRHVFRHVQQFCLDQQITSNSRACLLQGAV